MIRDIIKKVKRLLGYTTGCRFALFCGIAGNAINRFLTVWFIADLTANAVAACQTRDSDALWKSVFSAIPLLFIILIIGGLSAWLCGLATSSASRAMREELFSAALDSSLQENGLIHSGQMLSYFANDIPSAIESLIPALSQPAGAVFMGLGGLFYVLSSHPSMAVIAIGIGIFTFFYSILFAGWLHRISVKIQSLLADLDIRLRDLLDGMVTVRMFSMRGKLESEMDITSSRLHDTGVLWARVSAHLGGMNNFISAITDQVLIFTAGFLFLRGSLEIPELLRIAQMAGGIIGVFHVSRLLVSVQKSLAGAERVFDYYDSIHPEKENTYDENWKATENICIGNLKAPKNTRNRNLKPDQKTGEPAVFFDHVSFSYNNAIPILNDVSFDIKAGEFIAITGPSGNGKSTILRLIQGLYDSDTGSIKIGGKILADWDLKDLRAITALVPQEIILFPGTIAENIALGLDNIPVSEIETVSRMAGAHDFISEMLQGYDTPVSERGSSLSGGQKQRIAIARALLRNAPILLLDEATSAMDSHSEKLIYDMLNSLKGSKTILFVTHRTSVLAIADRVIQV